MPRVRVQGTNDVIDFPDGLSQEQIRQALMTKYSGYAPSVPTMPSNRLSTAEPYEPTLSEKLSTGISDTLYDSGVISDRYGANRIGQNVGMVTEALPVIGDVVGGDDLGRAIAQGDSAGIGLGLLSAIPVVGDASKAFKFAPKNTDKVDLSGREFFHGTSDVIEYPSVDKSQQRDPGLLGEGFYVTESPELASSYANISSPREKFGGEYQGPNIHPMNISAKNTLVLDPAEGKKVKEFLRKNPTRAAEFTDNLKSNGYDSVAISDGNAVQEINIFDELDVNSKFDAPKDPLYKFSNVNPEYVETIDELGGLPSPSIGIAKADDPVDSFGEISLIGRVGSFEGDPTFAADVYSPRQPRAEIEIPEDNIVAEQARLKADNPDIYQNYGAPRLDTDSDPISAARTEPAFIAEFARSKGIDVSPESQTTESKKLLDLESYFGTELGDDTGITETLSQQAKKYFASQLPPRPPEGASEIRKKKYRNKLELHQAMFTDGELNDLGYDVLKSEYNTEKARSMFDARTASRNLRDQLREKGLDSEYEEFISNKVKSLNPEKSLFDRDYFYNTGERRSLDYNLDNITKMMTKGEIRGGEGFAGASGGGARALVTPQLKSLKDIKDARGRIITSDEFSGLTSEMSDMTVKLQSELIKDIPEIEDLAYDYNGFYSELKDYINGSGSILDGLSDKNKKLLDLYIKSLEEMPTEYFEIKPQRAVELSEFYGAAVPKGTSRKVTAPLENAGLKIEYYDPQKGRQSAIKSLHRKSKGEILFSAGGIALVTAASQEEDEEL